MPHNKDLKRLVRARMKKTGESYTAARVQITKKRSARKRPAASKAAGSSGTTVADPSQFAKIAGMSDEVVKNKTGCTWERWVYALDRHGAAEMSHREIAALVHTKYKVPDWWTQMVTVGYERIKGLRARGQRRDGSYEANKSRTYAVDADTLFDAWANDRTRKRWLDESGVTVRAKTKPKSLRLGWPDGTTAIVWLTPKSASKTSVAVQHTKLADAESASRFKRYWSERLDALGEVLAER